jgi:hypothetical protein
MLSGACLIIPSSMARMAAPSISAHSLLKLPQPYANQSRNFDKALFKE